MDKIKLVALESANIILACIAVFFFAHLCIESSFNIPTWRMNNESWKITVLFSTHIFIMTLCGIIGYKIQSIKESIIFLIEDSERKHSH